MKLSRVLLGVVIQALVAACSSISVSSDYDPAVDFSAGFERYGWLAVDEMQDSGVSDPLTHKLLRDAIDAEMAAKGFTLADGAPDFWVGYHAAVETKLSYRPATGSGFIFGPRGRVSTVVSLNTSNEPYTYDEGTLILDFLRGPSRELVWRGIASSPAHKHDSREERSKKTREAVRRMLAEFPPRK